MKQTKLILIMAALIALSACNTLKPTNATSENRATRIAWLECVYPNFKGAEFETFSECIAGAEAYHEIDLEHVLPHKANELDKIKACQNLGGVYSTQHEQCLRD